MKCYAIQKKPYDEVKAYYQEIMSEYTITYEEEINNENLYDAPTYLLEAETSDEISVFVMITDLTQIPDDKLETLEKVPKDAKTEFSLEFGHPAK